MRSLIAGISMLILAANAFAGDCNGTAEAKAKFSDSAIPDGFIVESFGKQCSDARVVIYVKTADAGWHVLMIGELMNFAGADVTPATLASSLKEIAGRIEPSRMKRFETWAELKKAETQPGGNPWHGTPLVRTEYERIVK